MKDIIEKFKIFFSLKNSFLQSEPAASDAQKNDPSQLFDSETLALFYQGAQLFYDEKEYEKDGAILSLLVLLNTHEYAFWVSLGHCEYQSLNYKNPF